MQIILEKKKKLTVFLKSGIFAYILTEALENILEEFIAIGITTIATKALSVIFVFLGVQITKITGKAMWFIIKNSIKKITYKEGADKMEKLKNFFNSIKINPKTTIGTIASIIASVGVGGLSYFAMAIKTELPNWAVILIGVGIFVILSAGLMLGVFSKGKESEIQILLRKTAEVFGFEKAYDVVLSAKNEYDRIEAERIAIEKQVQEEEEKARLEQEAIAREVEMQESEKKEAEEKKKIEEKAKQKKLEYAKAVESGYEGTFKEWLSKNY